MHKFKRGDKVVMYKADEEASWYGDYIGMVGTCTGAGKTLVGVNFGGRRLTPWAMNLRLAHGSCPMEVEHARV